MRTARESGFESDRERRAPVQLRCSALILRDDSVLVCRRTDQQDVWVLPGGTPSVGEGTALATQREVEEETGLLVDIDRVAFVLETTSSDMSQHLIEIVFVGQLRIVDAEPRQTELGLLPSFVPLDRIDQVGLRPPIAGYIRGFARYQLPRTRWLHPGTAAYLGNLWRMFEDE